jgi:hypothetical protein
LATGYLRVVEFSANFGRRAHSVEIVEWLKPLSRQVL